MKDNGQGPLAPDRSLYQINTGVDLGLAAVEVPALDKRCLALYPDAHNI